MKTLTRKFVLLHDAFGCTHHVRNTHMWYATIIHENFN